MISTLTKVALLALTVLAIAATAQADDRDRATLGVVGQWIPGYGQLVTKVANGSQAQRLGLEQDDVILAVNGERLTHRAAFTEALAKAQRGDGRIALKYRDCRTGTVSERQTTLPTTHSMPAEFASTH